MLTDTGTGSDNCLGWSALLVVDNDAIRREVERELRTVREAIERCEQEITRHEELDLPAFRQWMAVQCNDLLNERRLIEERIWGLRARLSAIQGLTQHGVGNVAAAFFWFQEIERDEAAIPPYVRRAWEEVIVGPTEKPNVQGAESGRFDDGWEETDEDTFADWSSGAADAFEEGSAGPAKSEHGQKEAVSRHKSLYRKIALLLHPDLAGVLTKQELELWYQAQRAYEARDAAALEIILARCNRVGTNALLLSELRALVQEGQSRLATLQLSIAGLAGLPSWRFLLLETREVKNRLREVCRELEGVNRGLLREATLLETELARIEERAERWMKRRKGGEKQLALGI
jgi:hypothetical protein